MVVLDADPVVERLVRHSSKSDGGSETIQTDALWG